MFDKTCGPHAGPSESPHKTNYHAQRAPPRQGQCVGLPICPRGPAIADRQCRATAVCVRRRRSMPPALFRAPPTPPTACSQQRRRMGWASCPHGGAGGGTEKLSHVSDRAWPVAVRTRTRAKERCWHLLAAACHVPPRRGHCFPWSLTRHSSGRYRSCQCSVTDVTARPVTLSPPLLLLLSVFVQAKERLPHHLRGTNCRTRTGGAHLPSRSLRPSSAGLETSR